MEELRSTEILDKEIEADARKRAESILRRTEEECKDILGSVKGRVESVKKERTEFYNKKTEAFENDQKNSIPLEKERFLVAYVQKAFSENINEYLGSMTQEKRIELVINRSKNGIEILKDKKVNAYVYGFELAAAKKALEKVFGKNLVSCNKTEFNKLIVEDDLSLNYLEGIIVEAEDLTVRIRMTMSEIFSQIEDEHREELFNALFDGRLSQ